MVLKKKRLLKKANNNFILLVILFTLFSCKEKEQKETLAFNDNKKALIYKDDVYVNKQIEPKISFEEILKSNSYKIYNIDINKDNIKDKVASNKEDNELLFFIKEKGEYKNVYKGDNYILDGIYFVDDIKAYKQGNYVCCIKTFFNGSGGQNINYFIEYVNQKWKLKKSITYNLSNESNRVCIDYLIDDEERCINLKENYAKILSNFNMILKENKHYKDISDELIYTLLLNFKLDKKTLVAYNNMGHYLEQSELYSESIFLLEKVIEKFPSRTVAYINLGDAYWGVNKQEKAKKVYNTYITQMRKNDNENKIPATILKRVKE